jgi:hypothetical protein
MIRLRQSWPILAILAASLGLRLVLAYVIFPGEGLTADLGLFRSWATTLGQVGPGAFYASAAGANYPPGYLYLLWLLDALAHPLGAVTGMPVNQALVSLLKLPAIAADIGIGWLLHRAGRRWFSARAGCVAAALYLFIPVSWYDSALWGQVDAIGALLMLATLLLLIDGWSEAAAGVAALGVLVKPQDVIVFVVVVPVLVRRHLVRIGSGPVPRLGRRLRRLNARLDGLLVDQGPVRLGTSALVAAVALILPLLPFDIARLAPAVLSDTPVVGHVAGLIGLVASAGNEFSVLTANAYNAWALAGPSPLATVIGSGVGSWTPDSITVLGGIPAFALAAILLGGTALLVGAGLLIRDDRLAILLGFTVMAVAFYVEPTRVHERYLFAAFVSGALLVAGVGWRVLAYLGVALLNALNIHAVLAAPVTLGPPGGFGGAGGIFGNDRFGIRSISLPFADLARSEPVVLAAALGQTLALAGLLVAWAIVVLAPAVARHEVPERARVPHPRRQST